MRKSQRASDGTNVKSFFANWDRDLGNLRRELQEEGKSIGRSQPVRRGVGGGPGGGWKRTSTSSTREPHQQFSSAPPGPSLTSGYLSSNNPKDWLPSNIGQGVGSNSQQSSSSAAQIQQAAAASAANIKEYMQIWCDHDRKFREFQEMDHHSLQKQNSSPTTADAAELETGGGGSGRIRKETEVNSETATQGSDAQSLSESESMSLTVETQKESESTKITVGKKKGITYDDIPWPPVPSDILHFCEALWSPGYPKQAYRIACRRWHPDKFMALYGDYIVETSEISESENPGNDNGPTATNTSERNKIENKVKEVFQAINNQYQMRNGKSNSNFYGMNFNT